MNIPGIITALKRNKLPYTIAVLLVLTIGILIRTRGYPDLPPGLSRDEAGSAYDAYSLSLTGKDKSGNKWPAYFPAWGSGQNVLQAYLSIPFIKWLGLSIFSARLVPLLSGILTLPLFFFTLLPLGRFTALFATFVLAVLPWHFMLSRWGLESNLLPFVMLAGCSLLCRAFITQRACCIIPSLIPFALALYAYGIVVVILPVFGLLILLLNYRIIKTRAKYWLLACLLFLIISCPFLLFFTENFLLKKNIAFTDQFFFSTPLLPSNRLHQITGNGLTGILRHNIRFLLSGFYDGTNYNQLPGYKLLFTGAVPLIIAGIIFSVRSILLSKKSNALTACFYAHTIFTVWALASLVLFFFVELNVNRFNHFFIPSLVIIAWLTNEGIKKITSLTVRFLLQSTAFIWITFQAAPAVKFYFTTYKNHELGEVFNAGLNDAFAAASQLQVGEVDISPSLKWPVYALFYLKYSPEEFRKTAVIELRNGTYFINRIGKYSFVNHGPDSLKISGYLYRSNELAVPAGYQKKVTYRNQFWEVGILKSLPEKN